MRLVLPYPVSANRYWRSPTVNGRPRVLISKAGVVYRNQVFASFQRQKPKHFRRLAIPVSVSISACPPDRRRRDLDNCFKVLFDALTHAGVWGDDSQVHRIEAEWGPIVKGGEVVIEIGEY